MFYNSVIIGFVFTLLHKLKTAYGESKTAKIIKSISEGTKNLFSNSSIWKFVWRKDFYSRVWEHSGIYSFLNWLLNGLPKLFSRFYFKNERIYSESLVIKLMKYILRSFHIVLSLCLVLMVIVPHDYWNNAYSMILAVFLAFLYFIKIIFNKFEGFDLKAIDFVLFIFAILIALAVGTSIFPWMSTRFLIFYFTCFLLVLTIVSSIKTERSLGQLLDIFLVGITLTGLYGIWQAKVVGIAVDPAYIDVNTNSNSAGRVFSTVGNPNNYAEILILTLPFYLAAVFNAKTVFKKIMYVLLALPPLISLVWTGARMSWIAFAAAILVYTFFKNKKLVPFIILAGLLCIPVLPQSIYRRLMSINFTSDSSILYRFKIYETVLPMLKDYWITGVGLGTDVFMKICENYYQVTKKVPPHAHNIYLQLWLETGLAGVLTFVWFNVRLLKKSIINICNKSDKYVNNILIAGISSLTGILLMGFAEYIWFYPRVMLVFWIVVGIILAALGIANSRREGISQKNM